MVALPSLCGAAIMWFYFTYVDYSSGVRRPLLDLAVFALVTGTLIGAGLVLGGRRFRPLDLWLDRLRDGADAAAVPPEI